MGKELDLSLCFGTGAPRPVRRLRHSLPTVCCGILIGNMLCFSGTRDIGLRVLNIDALSELCAMLNVTIFQCRMPNSSQV